MAVDPLVRVHRAAEKSSAARRDFEQAIRDAAKRQRTLSEIALAAGMTKQRVHQIVHGR